MKEQKFACILISKTRDGEYRLLVVDQATELVLCLIAIWFDLGNRLMSLQANRIEGFHLFWEFSWQLLAGCVIQP